MKTKMIFSVIFFLHAFSLLAAESRITTTLTTSAATPTSSIAIPVTATFSEAVSGFNASDISVSNATVSGFLGAGSSYSFKLVPQKDGKIKVSIKKGVAETANGIPNQSSNKLGLVADITAPVAELSLGKKSKTDGKVIINVRFSEDVEGFTETDLALSNATASDLKGSGTKYSVTLTPTENAQVQVKAGAVRDEAENLNPASQPLLISGEPGPTPTPTPTATPTPSSAAFCPGAVCVDDTYRNIGTFTLTATLKSGSGADTQWSVGTGHLLGEGVTLASGDLSVVRGSNPLTATITTKKVGTFRFNVTSGGTTDQFLVRTFDPAQDSKARCTDGSGGCVSGTRHNHFVNHGGVHTKYENGKYVECGYQCQKDILKTRRPGGRPDINGMGFIWYDNFKPAVSVHGVSNQLVGPAPTWGLGLDESECNAHSWDIDNPPSSSDLDRMNACEPDWYWEDFYHEHSSSNSGIQLGSGSHTVENFVLTGADSIEFTGSFSGYLIRDMFIPFAGDDGVEADACANGTIDDTLIDASLQAIAMEGGCSITLTNTIIRKTQRYGIYKGKSVPGQGGFFKFAGSNPTAMKNNIFITGKINAGSNSGDNLTLSHGLQSNSYNNIIIYMGTEPDSTVWSQLGLSGTSADVQKRFIITRDPSIYLEARDDWFVRHPDIRAPGTGYTP